MSQKKSNSFQTIVILTCILMTAGLSIYYYFFVRNESLPVTTKMNIHRYFFTGSFKLKNLSRYEYQKVQKRKQKLKAIILEELSCYPLLHLREMENKDSKAIKQFTQKVLQRLKTSFGVDLPPSSIDIIGFKFEL